MSDQPVIIRPRRISSPERRGETSLRRTETTPVERKTEATPLRRTATTPVERKTEVTEPNLEGIPPEILSKIFEFVDSPAQIIAITSNKKLMENLIQVTRIDLFDRNMDMNRLALILKKYPNFNLVGINLNWNSWEVSLLEPFFPRLERIRLVFPQKYSFKDLSFLQRCKNLVELELEISTDNLTGIEKCTNLARFKIKHLFQNLDVSALEGHPNLKILHFDGDRENSKLSNANKLKSMPLLEEVFINGTNPTNISSFEGCPNLKKLFLSNLSVCRLSPLDSEIQLLEFTLYSCDKVNNIGSLSEQVKLQKFTIENSAIDRENLDFLEDCKEMKYVKIEQASIDDITMLGNLSLLETMILNLRINGLQFLDDLDNLKTLQLGPEVLFNAVNMLNIPVPGENYRGLESLSMTGNIVNDDIDNIALNTGLKFLSLNNTGSFRISLDELKACTKLEELTLIGSKYPSYDFLESLTSLLKLKIEKSSLSTMTNLENCKLLQELEIYSINAKHLQGIEKLEKLEKLTITGTALINTFGLGRLFALKSLVLAETNIKEFYLEYNLSKLEYLSLKQCRELERIPGLEKCPNLKEFTLVDSQVKDIRPLSRCLYLKRLTINNSLITNVLALVYCMFLEKADLSYNFELADLSGIMALSQLKEVDLLNISTYDPSFRGLGVTLRGISIKQISHLEKRSVKVRYTKQFNAFGRD